MLDAENVHVCVLKVYVQKLIISFDIVKNYERHKSPWIEERV